MLSKRAKYGLNALVELARAREEGPLSAATIASRAHVPGKFLEAILLDLRHAGMISSTKGSGTRSIRDPMCYRSVDGSFGVRRRLIAPS